jgi:2-polyprenyl-3-methyl-5-hydroxy-6-metoxy-1,4-benzoquinol methylase
MSREGSEARRLSGRCIDSLDARQGSIGVAETGALVELQRTLYSSRNPTRRWLHQSRRERVESAVRRLAKERGRAEALEVGPGSGIYLPLLCELFERVTATDIERAYLDHLGGIVAQWPNLEPEIDDIACSGLEPESFDFVLCSEVIEHTPEPARVVAGLRRVLRPGGTLVLTTPQARSTLELASKVAFLPGIIDLVRSVYKEPILPTGHVSLLTVRQVDELLTSNGFRVLEHHTSGLYLPLVSELGGQVGLDLERRLERRISRGRLDGLLWTQYWVAERAR